MKVGVSPTKGEKGDGLSSGAAMERVAPGSGVVELPLLTKGNYQEWSLVMQALLEALELWDMVEEASKDRAKDRRALAAILRGIPPEMKAGHAVKKSAKEAWDSVKKMRGGDDRVKAANVQRLMKEFENLSFRDGEAVGDFAVRVDHLTARLGDLGEVLPARLPRGQEGAACRSEDYEAGGDLHRDPWGPQHHDAGRARRPAPGRRGGRRRG